MSGVPAGAVAAAAEAIHGAICEWDLAECMAEHVHDRAAAEALAAAAPVIDAAELPAIEGEPLTHFFHCWRSPDHQACAVALIERQAEENDRLIIREGIAERASRDAATSERKRIRQIAERAQAVYLESCGQKPYCTHGDHMKPFADLLNGDPS